VVTSGDREAVAGVGAELTFEQARAELEQIVAQLESGGAGLEDAIALWERGEQLYRICVAKLDAVHGRLEELERQAKLEPGGE
jgi:exodeoxyribonuclease VII small subunit